MSNLRQKLREAIVDLSRHGCDLSDPSVPEGIRADEVRFHLGYLESYCGRSLTVGQVLRVARQMGKDVRRNAHPVGAYGDYYLMITNHVELN